jgi:hypothetical protein
MVWLFGSLVGALIVALPDDNARLFSLSRTHGPSAGDLLGIAILIAAWLPVLLHLWSGRSSLRGRWGALPALLAGTGILVLAITIAADTPGWWLVGVTLLILAQLLAVVGIAKARARDIERSA